MKAEFFFIFALIGIVFMVVGYVLWMYAARDLRHRHIETEGTIIDLKPSSDHDTYAPVVTYVDDQNREITQASTLHKSLNLLKKYQVGTHVTVLYDPLDSSKILIQGYDTSFLIRFGQFFVIFGVFFFLIGLFVSLFV